MSSDDTTFIDEANELLAELNVTKLFGNTDMVAQALRRAYNRGMQHCYVFCPLVKAPWGETQLFIVLHAKDFYDAQRRAVAELQKYVKVPGYAWIQPALDIVRNAPGAVFVHGEFDRDRVHVFWYDEREAY
jgi:hypothetical protein